MGWLLGLLEAKMGPTKSNRAECMVVRLMGIVGMERGWRGWRETALVELES